MTHAAADPLNDLGILRANVCDDGQDCDDHLSTSKSHLGTSQGSKRSVLWTSGEVKVTSGTRSIGASATPSTCPATVAARTEVATAALTTLFAKQDSERTTVGAPPQQGGSSPYSPSFFFAPLALACALGAASPPAAGEAPSPVPAALLVAAAAFCFSACSATFAV